MIFLGRPSFSPSFRIALCQGRFQCLHLVIHRARFQRLASSDPPVRSVAIEIGSVITASIVAGLSAFFFCEWRGWPPPLTALVITLASWGGKRVLDQAVDAGLRRIQGEKP
jgi:hypothetical protein